MSAKADEARTGTDIIPAQERALQSVPITPMTMLQMAVEQGADLDKMEKLMELQERWEATEAKKAFDVAMTKFKAETIEIVKDKKVSYKTSSGTTEYKHASLHGVVTTAAQFLSKHGLSHKWRTSQGEGGIITVACVITHKKGHSEETALCSGPDQSGGKNNIQAIASTVSYLERYTFLAATGLTAKEMDDDGATAEPIDTITEKQIANLESLITEVGANKPRFMQYYKINAVDQLPKSKYTGAVKQLEKKRIQS